MLNPHIEKPLAEGAISRKRSVEPGEYVALNRQLVAFFRRRCRSRADPRDLAADTWVGVVRWYEGKCSLRTFAFRVAGAVLCDHWRKRRIVTVPLFERDDIEVPDDDANLDRLLMLAAGHDAMARALEHVTDHYRDVLVLQLDGRDNHQIAAELGIAYHTVRSRINRGKAQLLAALVGTEGEGRVLGLDDRGDATG